MKNDTSTRLFGAVFLLFYTHLGLEDAVDEMNRMQQLESARKEQEALSGKTDEVRLLKKHFRAG